MDKLLARIKKAEIYLDEPYTKKLKGEELKKAIVEREKHIPAYIELIKECNKLNKK